MAVPGFQEIMLPLLRVASDSEPHKLVQAIATLADYFQLSPLERTELLPSGRQARFSNRVGWAKTYLSKAGLLEAAGGEKFRITQHGRDVLNQGVETINMTFLDQYPEYVAFKTSSRPDNGSDAPGQGDQTPHEIIEANYQLLMDDLQQELLAQVKQRSPQFFENLVVDLLVQMGYGGSRAEAGQRIGRSGDGGIDGIIKEDKLGLDVVYIQAKRWEGTVGRPTVQAFAGSLEGHRARKGVMITTSRFSDEASQYVEMIEKKIVLIDGAQLVSYMIQHGLGVAETATYSVKRIALDELDYFEEGGFASGANEARDDIIAIS